MQLKTSTGPDWDTRGQYLMCKAAEILFILLALLTLTAGSAHALEIFTSQFNAEYDTAGTDLGSCLVCHNTTAGEGGLNSYGMSFSQAGASFAAIEGADSDGDGFANIDEIMALTFPGDAQSTPAPTTSASAATFDPATLTLHVPCLDLAGASYFLDLVLTDPATLTFTLTKIGAGAASPPCATLDLTTFVLHIPDLDLGASFFLDLQVSSVANQILFQIINGGANP